MIGSILKFLLFKPLGLIILGILVMGAGATVTSLGHADVPDRAALTQVSGALESATKITRKRRGSSTISYELPIRSAGGEVIKLTLPEREISEDTVRKPAGPSHCRALQRREGCVGADLGLHDDHRLPDDPSEAGRDPGI